MGVYEVETDDGSVYEITTADDPLDVSTEPLRPSWGQSSSFVGRSLAEGAGEMADTALLQNPLIKGAAQIAGTQSPFTDLMHTLFGAPEESGVGGAVADVSRAAVKGSLVPGGQVINALSAASGEIGHQIAPDSTIVPLAMSLAPAAGTAAARGVAGVLDRTGRALNRNSIGTTAANFTRSQKVAGLLDDADTGETKTRLAQAIDEVANKEGLGFWRSPQALLEKNTAILEDLGEDIGTVLRTVDEAGAIPNVERVLSPGGATQRVIANAKAERPDVQKAFDQFMERFTDPMTGWNGTTADLNRWKSSVQKMAFSGSADGTLKADVARKLQRAIQFDLERSVDDAVISSGVIARDDWHGLMRRYSNRAEMQPVLEVNVAKAEGNTLDRSLIKRIATTGGVLTTPTVTGSILGGAVGGPVGLAAGATLGALSTQTGRGVVGEGMRGAAKALSSVSKNARSAALAGIHGEQARARRNLGDTTDQSIEGMTEQSPGSSPTLPTTQEYSQREQGLRGNEEGQRRIEPSSNSSTNLSATEAPLDTLMRRNFKRTSMRDVKDVEAEIDQDPYYSALYEAESSRNPAAKNPSSTATGGFQLIAATAKALGVEDPTDLEQSFDAVKRLTSQHDSEFGDDPVSRYAAHFLGATLLRKVVRGELLKPREQEILDDFNQVALPRFVRIYEKIAAKEQKQVTT